MSFLVRRPRWLLMVCFFFVVFFALALCQFFCCVVAVFRFHKTRHLTSFSTLFSFLAVLFLLLFCRRRLVVPTYLKLPFLRERMGKLVCFILFPPINTLYLQRGPHAPSSLPPSLAASPFLRTPLTHSHSKHTNHTYTRTTNKY